MLASPLSRHAGPDTRYGRGVSPPRRSRTEGAASPALGAAASLCGCVDQNGSEHARADRLDHLLGPDCLPGAVPRAMAGRGASVELGPRMRARLADFPKAAKQRG